ncbi:hypothetical protein D3C80_1708480 [compost metagenome]
MADMVDGGHGACQMEGLIEGGGGGSRQPDMTGIHRQRSQQCQRLQARHRRGQTVYAGCQRIADEEHVKGTFFGLLSDPGEPVNVRRRTTGTGGTPAADVVAQRLHKQAET